LRSELDQVTAELEGAKMEYASLAKIAGLEAQRVALSRAVPGPEERSGFGSADIPAKYRTEDIAKVRRGVYRALRDPQGGPDRIVISLTQGNLNNHHIYLSGHLDFFP
jgi:hypothetical protein